MNEEDRIKLLKNRVQLESDLLIDDLIPHLIQSGILSLDDRQFILLSGTDREKAGRLLDLLPKRGPDAYEAFIKCLKTDHIWLAEGLDSTPVFADDKRKYASDKNKDKCTPDKDKESGDIRENVGKVTGQGYDTVDSIKIQEAIIKVDTSLSYDVMKIVRKNLRLIRNWENLARSLGLYRETLDIQRRINMEMKRQDECLVYLLEAWQSIKPREATVMNLVRHLRQEEFNDIADELELRLESQ